ncbi:DMT family transporter [Uliginosibacterium sp. 31-16]|uniref:DMT family transporter n=1 Tax=Uliginosibacterium sp. 31-16 TaxID=3068315 RepID=UPI00273ED11E|nr:DMT family transporter [Uliginosibacterium sp. 31-16]MDP5240454.1 DMT family transporter [Uliginosibacterium sp. 31-16]
MAAPHPLRGVALFACAVFLFACLDTTIKHLTVNFSVPLLAFVRYFMHLLLMLAIVAPRHGLKMAQARRPGLVILRALCLVVMTLFMMFGLKRLPLAEATAIGFVAPLLVVLLARPLLGERIGLLRLLAVLSGFGGVLLVARPGSDLDWIGVLFVLVAALCGTAYQLLSRVLVGSESTLTLLFYVALAGAVCFGSSLPWVLHGPQPGWFDALLMLSLGVTGGLGHYLFTHAYHDAPASLLAPFSYLQLLWAGLLGWLVFGRVPDHLTLLGMGIIAVAGVVVAVQQHRSASSTEQA